ncbi:MAG TPA: hypothetical protein VGQ46_16225 [Thermoanaerobaculia bacterium]|jgi:uncharacterized repeat protein (TIGR01451 family)|nr:hypothetical protein [Thermoanaerobaculia bacterium]
MTTADRLKLRTILTSSAVTLLAIAVLGTATAFAVCVPTVYNVTSSAPPPSANWTDTSGAVWTPSGGFPGCAPGDTAADTNGSPTTLIINSAITNAIIGLNLSCPGCAIDIQSGGSLTLAGPGSVSSSATIIVEPGGTLTIASGGTLTFNAGSSLSVNGGHVDLKTGGILNLNGASSSSNGGVLDVNGGTLQIGALFTVQSSGTLQFTSGSVTGGNTINNQGTIKMVGSGLVTVSPIVNNSAPGTVNVTSGTLALAGGGTGDAPFAISSGATLDFPSAKYNMTANGVVSGDGTLSVSGGTLSIGGVTSPGTFSLTAGTLDGPGFLSIRNFFFWDGGTITGAGGTELAGTGSGVLSGVSGAMNLSSRIFNNYGTINYSVDPTTANSPLTLTGSGAFNTYGTTSITADGSIMGGAGTSFGIFPNGVVQKTGGTGTSTINPPTTNDSVLFGFSGTIVLAGDGIHHGQFSPSSGGTIAFAANDTKLINALVFGDGNIAFLSESTSDIDAFYVITGQTSIANANVTFESSAQTKDFLFNDAGFLGLIGDFEMTGTGTWAAGTIQYNDGAFLIDPGATLNITSENGITTLDGAEIDNGGTINYTATGSVLAGRVHPSVKALTTSSGYYLELVNGSVIFNDGLFDIKTDSPIVSGSSSSTFEAKPARGRRRAATATLPSRRTATGRVITHRARTTGVHVACGCSYDFENESVGTLQKSAGSGTTDFGPSFGNSGTMKALSGVLNFQVDYFQDGGETTLGPGNIKTFTPMDLEGGVLDGSGIITGDVSNSANVKPGTATAVGTITVTGNYRMDLPPGNGAVTIKIASPASFDQLNITGTATLAATFNGSFINGYTPATGTTTWPVITYASETGTFTTVNPPTYPTGSVTHAYNATSFNLTAVTPAAANLRLVMNGPSAAGATSPISYTIDVSNLGPDPTSGVITVVDTLPAGVTTPSGSGSGWSCGPPSSGTITCTNAGPLTNGNSLPTLTISMTAPVASGNISNSATVSNSVSDPVPSNNTASVTTNIGPQANLAITKTVTSPAPPNPVNVGQNITYSIVVKNNGPSTATGVTVSDPTPNGLTLISVAGASCTSWPCTVGTLNSGTSVTLTSMYNVSPSYSGGPIVNTATVSNTETDPNLADNQSTTTTNVGAPADVSITKTGPPAISLGQNITYTITVSNFGPAGATGVTVSDTTPAGLTPVSVSGGGCVTFPCSIGALAVGPPVTITATYNVPVTYSGASPILNTATVSSASDPNAGNNSSTASTTVAAQADLGITKSGPPSVPLGQNITYTINITNTGALAAANTFVSDPTPAGLTPVSVSGGGCVAFPCALGTINPGGSVAITAVYNVPVSYASPSITNTASVSTASPEANLANNSAVVTTPVSGPTTADLKVTKSGPATASFNDFIDFTVTVTNNGPGNAANVVINDPTPAGLQFIGNSGACATPYPCTVASLGVNAAATVTSHYRVTAQSGTVLNLASAGSAATDPVIGNNSGAAAVEIGSTTTCPQQPLLTAPIFGTTVSSPVTFSWTNVPGATTYIVSITTSGTTQTVSAATNSLSQALPNGAYTWTVQANGPNACQATSASASFNVCNAPAPPVPSVVGVTTTGQTYNVQWTATEGTTLYELQEAGDAAFTSPTSFTIGGTSQAFTKNVSAPVTFFYRVRSLAGCNPAAGSFSGTAPIVIIPEPALGTLNINVPVPAGSKTPVTFPIHVPGLPNLTTSFFATVDKPWLSVTPSNGVMPPEGLNFTISADPSTLSDGTWTGTVIVVYGANGVSGKQALDVAPKTSIPVSISLTSPVSPGTLSAPSATALVIPSVGHLPGFSSQWQSDIRIANVTALSKKVQLTFSAGSANSQAVKQTTLSIDPGATIAFDDIVRNWFGIGAASDSSNGVLTVQPLDAAGKPDLSVTKAAVVSSRTFNSSALGTLGQFIPAVPLANFISKLPGSASILALQQIAQTDAFHTNLGLVEATGKPASVLVSVFNGTGSKVLDIPATLAAGEQRQLNSFLADSGTTLTNGHIEVQATGGDGRVTAYASVVDNRTTDPLLVSGVPLGAPGASRFVIPGVASLDTGATWRSDVRVFNSSLAPQTATLTLYPTGNPSASVSSNVTIQPGEVKALDDIVHSTFNLTNAGGVLHVTTATVTPLIVTARTFNDTAAGTLGQFLQAVTPADAVGNGERSLQLLQMEDSPRYRTNLGLAEVTGKAATAEVTVILPDSKVAPKVQIPLAAFEYRQFSIISSLGLGNVYNARISVRVIDGQGKVTAYGSVIDQKTQDPTFVPAQ